MNILIFSWRGPKHPNAGGAEQVTLEHAKAWVKVGHNVYWFTSTFKDVKSKDLISKVKIIRNGRQFFDVQARAFFWYVFGKHQKFDLVIDQFHGIPFFTPLYVRTKKLAFIHEVAKEVWKLNPWPKPFNLIPAIIGTFGEPLMFKIFYKETPFMTVSESTRDDLIAWGIPEKNITIIHNGVKLDLPDPIPQKEDKKTAMFLGALSEDKGIEDALKTFGEINKKDGNWQFWVVGKASREYEKIIKDMARELGFKSNFKYWGYVGDKKKFELLARAHVLINPSIREGWGLVNIEANSVGTPVVAYNVAGIRDSVINGKSGILVDIDGGYRKLAEVIVKLTKNKDGYVKLQKNCRLWASNFNWEKAVKLSTRLVELSI
jgi:glycosyltransferase involved in cell wall biosynthesis